MAINKVVYDDQTLIDISGDTVTPDTLLAGATAHDASGQAISGAVDLSIYATKTELNDKVDKVSGKGLSTNDYTTTEKNKLSGIETGAQKNTITGVKGNAESTYRTGNVNITPTNIGLGNVANERQYSASNPPPTATGSTAGMTIVYPAASCTTYTSDSGTCTPLAVQNAAKKFAITRPSSTTNKAIARYSNTTGDVQNSTVLVEDVTNSKDSSKKGQVISIPVEGNKKMVYGYCTDQTDGTAFLGGLFASNATSFPYDQGLAIGGSSGNLLWKGKVIPTLEGGKIPSANLPTFPVTITQDGDNDVAVINAPYAKLSDGKELLTPDNIGDNVALKSEGTIFVKGTGSTVGVWSGTSDRITDLYDGLAIRYKIPVNGSTTTTLNINGKGAKTVYRFGTTKLTTQFPVGSIINLIYHASDGSWKCSDYDANTNTQMRVYRQTTGYTTAEYPLLVSRTKAADIATPGSNDSYEAVYGVMWNDTSKVPMLNPSTGELKAVKFTGKVTQLDERITIEERDAGDHAVIHAPFAVLKNGSSEDRLVTGTEFDDFVDSQSSKGVVDGKGYIIIDKEEAPTGVTISDGTSGSSTLSLRVEEDELDSNQILVSQFADANISGNNVTFAPTFDSAGGSMPIIRIVYQTAKKSGTYNIRLSFSHKGSVTSQRPNEVLIWLNGTVVQVLTLTNGSTHNIPIPNVKAGDLINAAFYATVTSGATFNNYEATLKNICFSCEESLQSVANKSKLNPSYERAIIAASSNTQNLKATYYQGLNATLEKFRQAIIALGGTV